MAGTVGGVYKVVDETRRGGRESGEGRGGRGRDWRNRRNGNVRGENVQQGLVLAAIPKVGLGYAPSLKTVP